MIVREVFAVFVTVYSFCYADLPEFICTDGSILKLKNVCDGKIDCKDGSDEIKGLCYHIICPSDMYRCHYGACINKSLVCNGINECADESDESQCGHEKNSCSSEEYRCGSKECIPLPKICDGNEDCKDGSDENKNTCEEFPCPVNSYHCNHGGCIHTDARCDGYKDCLDGSDESEIMCKILKCSRDECNTLKNTLTCPPVISPRLSIDCQINDGPKHGLLPCDKPLPINTTVRYECKEYYKPASSNDVENVEMICQPDGTWSRHLLKCEPECGKKESSVLPLIVHGWKIQQGQWPWHATLYILEGGKWNFWCGGSLISELVVVTAAHCVWKKTPDLLRVAIGKIYTELDKEDMAQIRDVTKIIMQSSYQDQIGNYGSDLAVLVLDKPILFNEYIRPVCIDWDLHYIRAHLREGSLGTVVGMGINENDTFSKTLRTAHLPVVGNKKCIEEEAPDFRKYITFTSFCAGWGNGTGVCNGDSGGGLVFFSNNDQRWFLQGIVSVSPRRRGTSFCDPKFYTIFTKIGIYIKWISAVLNTIHPGRNHVLGVGPAIEEIH